MTYRMQRIINFGSLNVDKVYNVAHIVRPGETLSSSGLNHFAGGKGLNQSVALSRAGAEVFHAGKVGADGDILEQALLENNIDTSCLRSTAGQSGHAIIQVEADGGQNCILLHGGANREISAAMMDEVLDKFDSDDWLVCQNEISNMSTLLQKAAVRGMAVVLNPSPIDEDILKVDLKYVAYLVINEIEGQEFTGETDPDKICDALIARAPRLKVVLTLGKRGVMYRDVRYRYTHGIFNVPVVDSTAAGDTFLGYFTAEVSRVVGGVQPDIEKALRFASAASSIAVSRMGAASSIPSLEEVEVFLKGAYVR